MIDSVKDWGPRDVDTDQKIKTCAQKVAKYLGLSVEDALRGIQYGIELAQKEALDDNDDPRARQMKSLFEATLRVGREIRR